MQTTTWPLSPQQARPRTSRAGRTNCETCESRSRTEWCSLEGPHLQALSDAKIGNVYQPGQTIFYQGNPSVGIFCVESGTIAVRKNDEAGNSVIVRLAHAGDTLGYRSFFAGQGYRASAEALEPSRICFIDRAAVRRLLDQNPALGQAFLQRMARDLERSEEARLHAAALPVKARLAHLLLVLKDRFGETNDAGDLMIQLPLSRQDMAAMIGARPETIARAVRALEEEDIAHFEGRRCRVPDLDALLDAVEPE